MKVLKRNFSFSSTLTNSNGHQTLKTFESDFKSSVLRSQSIKIQLLTPKFVSQTVDCISETFSKSKDPFTIGFHFSALNWGIMSQTFVQRAAEKDLSFIAFNEDEEKVVGVILNEDWKEKPPQMYHQLSDWRAVRSIFYDLHHKFKEIQPRIDHGKVLHPLYFTCVRPEVRRQGVVSQLWEKSVELGRSRNYEMMVAEGGTAAVDRLLREKLGFREITNVKFEDFKVDDEFPLRSLMKEPGLGFDRLAIYLRSLTSNLYI